MYALYIEQRSISGKDTLSWDLAHHMYARSSRDKIIVVTDKPVEMLSATRKQWFKLMRKAMRQRSETLNVVRSAELTSQISYMQDLRFSAKRPVDDIVADVTFATADDLIGVAPVCSTAYVATDIERAKLYILTSWMPENGVVVVYVQHQKLAKESRKELNNGANAKAADQKSYQTTLR
jgi:hypothetical protein